MYVIMMDASKTSQIVIFLWVSILYVGDKMKMKALQLEITIGLTPLLQCLRSTGFTFPK